MILLFNYCESEILAITFYTIYWRWFWLFHEWILYNLFGTENEIEYCVMKYGDYPSSNSPMCNEMKIACSRTFSDRSYRKSNNTRGTDILNLSFPVWPSVLPVESGEWPREKVDLWQLWVCLLYTSRCV